LSRLDEAQPSTDAAERPLVDLPLRQDGADFSVPLPWEDAPSKPVPSTQAARLATRAGALAADIATVGLIWAAAVLAAGVVRGEMPRAAGLLWGLPFLLLLSFFATVPALILFGRTVGMAAADLAPQTTPLGRRLDPGQATRRWLGTLVTAATLGLALLFTLRGSGGATPADRWSGRALEEVES
jgi:RDD family protein